MTTSPQFTHESDHRSDGRSRGFTLIEVLIAIVVVGILAAVVIIGVGALTDKGSNSACTASADAAKAAAVVHFANTGSYPATIDAMVSAGELELPSGVTASGTSASGSGWTLTLHTGTPPTFTCGS